MIFAESKSGIRGLLSYRSTFRLRAMGDKRGALAAQRVFRFKSTGESAETWRKLIESAAADLGCVAVWTVPGHDPNKTSRLQELFGVTIRRTRTTERRKYNHAARVNLESLEFPPPTAGGHVLLVDDICTTGATLTAIRDHLASLGVEAVPLALGLSWRLVPKGFDTAVLDRQWESVFAEVHTPQHASEADRKASERRAGRDLRAAMEREGVVFDEATGLPVIGDPKRRARASKSLEVFARSYLPHVFSMPMSDGQKADLRTMQTCAVEGGRYCFADPRGDGKTSRVEAAILWAALHGHRRCVVIVGADLAAAVDILESVKTELRTNELLREDYPLPTWAASLSDDTALRAKSWTWNGETLAMRWGKGGLVLPVLDGADGTGCVIVPRGLTGRLRGMRVKVNKRAVRPDLYAIDDPQTDESAASPAQVDTREKLILGAIMGSGGPAETQAAFMPCTVIQHGDLAARFLDRRKHPDWQGSARGLVTTWPATQKTLWQEYATKRREDSPEAATAFYRSNRDAMDAGAAVDWQARYVKGKELSALQHAENLLCDLGEMVFFAEYQNDPREIESTVFDLPRELVAHRVNGLARRVAPDGAVALVGMCDVNADGIRWALAAATNARALSVVDYGIFPGHGRPLIGDGESEAVAIMRGLSGLDSVLSQVAVMKGTERMPIECLLLDCGGSWMQTVFDWLGTVRTSRLPWMASRGWGSRSYRPSRNVIGRPGDGWHLAQWPGKGRVLVHNSDQWRHRQQKGWLLPIGAPDAVSFFGNAGERHEVFADGVISERLVAYAETDQGPLYRWSLTPGMRNDFGDVATGLYVAASRLGLTPATVTDGDGALRRSATKARVFIARPSQRRGGRFGRGS